MPHPKVKIADNSGNEVAVTDNALHVNVAGATISTGDIEVNSEFPAAAVMTDDFANPTTTSVMSMLMGYDSSGSNWNRILTGTGSMSPSVLRVTLADDDPAVVKLGTIDTDTGNISNDTSSIKSSVQIIDNAIYVDDSSFTLGSGSGIPIMGYYGTQTITGNNAGILRCDGSGRLMVEIDSTTPDSETCFQLNGEAWGNVDIGVGVYAVRNDTLAALSNVDDGDYTPFQVNASGALYVEVATSTALTVDLGSNNDVTVSSGSITTSHDITGMVSGADVDIGTSSAAILGSTACKRVDIMAHQDNTGYIWIGGTNVAVNRGIRLAPGDFYSIDIDNVANIYAVATVDQEDIVFNYYT